MNRVQTDSLSAFGRAGDSPLQLERLKYIPRMPKLLRGAFAVERSDAPLMYEEEEQAQVREHFPHVSHSKGVTIRPNRGSPVVVGKELHVGVLFAGGPSPGGHNAVIGLLDYVSERNADSKIYGFLRGASGLINGNYMLLAPERVASYRNQGGFHLLGSDRSRVNTQDDFFNARKTVQELELDGLVFIGGLDTNVNAIYVAEDFAAHNIRTRVVSLPSTVDGDLHNQFIQAPFGFDTVVKVYSELVANLGYDATSAKKTYHFCRLMGRKSSHVALEVALQTRPNLCLISEEIAKRAQTLKDVVNEIANVVCERARLDKQYGLIVVPEGIVEHLADVRALLEELDEIIAKGDYELDTAMAKLSESARATMNALPPPFNRQLLMERDPHGNLQLSKVESERLLIVLVQAELKRRKQNGRYKGSFSAIPHYFGYEGRCSLPSNFDCNYAYALGSTAGQLYQKIKKRIAADRTHHGLPAQLNMLSNLYLFFLGTGALIENHISGYVCSVSQLTKVPEQWICGGYPLTMMMTLERRGGKSVATLKRKEVDLDSIAFRVFAEQRQSWRLTEDYRTSGPIQHFADMADTINFTLQASGFT